MLPLSLVPLGNSRRCIVKCVRALNTALAIGFFAVMALGLPLASEAATQPVSIFGVNGDDGGGNPNPACTGSATCAYNPNPVGISTGDSINFSNVGALNHTATGPTNFGPPLNTVVQPGGVCPAGANGNCFSTGSKNPGTSQNIGPFPNTSSFDFYCEVHGPGLMIGTLNVAGGGGTTTTSTTTTTTAGTTTTTAGTTTTTGATTTTTGATTTTTGATTTTTAGGTTTTTGATTTTTGATTTTTGATTTTTAGGCTNHNIVVSLPGSLTLKIFSTVNVPVTVTNAGNCPENAHLTLSAVAGLTSGVVGVQNAALAPGQSQVLNFTYNVPLALQVTFTASAPLSGDSVPANNTAVRTYPTTVL